MLDNFSVMNTMIAMNGTDASNMNLTTMTTTTDTNNVMGESQSLYARNKQKKDANISMIKSISVHFAKKKKRAKLLATYCQSIKTTLV
jgi:hypothetical protein